MTPEEAAQKTLALHLAGHAHITENALTKVYCARCDTNTRHYKTNPSRTGELRVKVIFTDELFIDIPYWYYPKWLETQGGCHET